MTLTIFQRGLLATIALFLSACDSGTELVSLPPRAPTAVFSNGPVTPTLRPTATATITPTPTPSITPTPSPTAPPTPIFAGTPSAACGRLLPLVGPADDTAAGTVQITASDAAVAALQAQMPDEAWPAVQRILDAPQTVGLVAYELGNPQNGLYINAEQPMPLASVFKLITLIAYVEAVEAGELEAQTRLTLAELDRYDLPGSNVGAHERAVDEARADGRVAADDTVTLDDVAWMAVRHSSNAAADYLHDLVGQEAMEQTVRDLELGTHTAPCPFLAQFLAIHHENRPGADITAVRAYLADPQAYAADGRRLADGFVNNADFRAQQGRWRADLQAQRLFADQLSPQASAADYAAVMARLAQNGLSSPDSSFHARKMIEWPMRFPVNQQLFTNLGYKDGLLPGVLTTAYYAYPADGRPPMVVVLFYRQLPHRTYQQWRYRLPHDAFARWLLTEPQGLRLVRGVLGK